MIVFWIRRILIEPNSILRLLVINREIGSTIHPHRIALPYRIQFQRSIHTPPLPSNLHHPKAWLQISEMLIVNLQTNTILSFASNYLIILMNSKNLRLRHRVLRTWIWFGKHHKRIRHGLKLRSERLKTASNSSLKWCGRTKRKLLVIKKMKLSRS